MDFLESSLMSPTVPVDTPETFQLKRKRGPAPTDRSESGLGEPLLEDDAPGQAVSLLGRVRRFAGLCMWPAGDSEVLIPTGEQQGVLSRLAGVIRRTARAFCETVINGFIWSAQAKPY